jgi:hypothetical protein
MKGYGSPFLAGQDSPPAPRSSGKHSAFTTSSAQGARPNQERCLIMKNNSAHSLALAARQPACMRSQLSKALPPVHPPKPVCSSSRRAPRPIPPSTLAKARTTARVRVAARIPARTLARVKVAAPPTVAHLPRLLLLPRRPSTDLCWGLEIAQASNVSVCLTTGAYDASQSIQRIY